MTIFDDNLETKQMKQTKRYEDDGTYQMMNN